MYKISILGKIKRESLYVSRCATLHICRRSGTGDDLDQLASDDRLPGSIVEDLEPADHVASVLGSVLARGQNVRAILGGEGAKWRLTSIALRRADCSQA